MGKDRAAGALHLLMAREAMAAGEGYHADGGGLYLLRRNTSTTWVYKYTAPTGRRREMGLGTALVDTPKAAGASLTTARELAYAARDLLRKGQDPVDERDRQRGDLHPLPTHRSRRWILQRTTGLPRNLTFAHAALEVVRDGGSGRSLVSITDLGKVPAERLHPKAAYLRC